MKKILLMASTFLLLGLGSVNAQNNTATTTKTIQSKTTTHVTKSGNPDRRFKENKSQTKVVKVRKDGQPDMRYKENKATSKTVQKKEKSANN